MVVGIIYNVDVVVETINNVAIITIISTRMGLKTITAFGARILNSICHDNKNVSIINCI